MSEVIRVRDSYYILATSPLADNQTRVLKHGDTFAIFDLYGDIRRLGRGEQGLYHKGTRHLSRSVLTLGTQRPLLLGSSVSEDNVLFAVDMTNPDMTIGETFVPRGTLHILRSIFLMDGACYERIRLFSYAEKQIEVTLTLSVEADFADIFEVRGTERTRRGEDHPTVDESGAIVMSYSGLDGVERRTRVVPSSEGEPSGSDIVFRTDLPPHSTREMYVMSVAEGGVDARAIDSYSHAISHVRESQERSSERQTVVRTSNELFNSWIDRSLSDLRMMITDTPQGRFPYGGVPWYSCPFGRDAIITALQLLWIDPSIARGVLNYLAVTQATEVNEERAAEPGKILHERRSGEMAALGEVPFGMYYGSVDSTPLFVALAGEYYTATGDLEFIRQIWPNIEAALRWIDEYGDVDGDGFVEYTGSTKGLVQQGWKDSHDSVFHANGEIAKPPIALVEVQGYVFWAKRQAAVLASALGDTEHMSRLLKDAKALRESFEDSFWSDEIGMYVIALDGDKRPCAVRASNAGHPLYTNIASAQRGRAVGEALLSDAFFSGWGVRTLATSEVRYGPITYHNGSVWPHDNAIIGAGLAEYGHKEGTERILAGLLDATNILEFHRLPELYCGFPRRPGQGPIEYPLACAPQSWAAGSVFMLLRACLGLTIDAPRRRIRISRPRIPSFLREMHLRGLRAGDASVDLALYAHGEDTGVNVTKREGDVEVVVVK
jgi:glycogen debranching enzyme